MYKENYDIIQKAIDFANEAHRGVNRKGVTIPYVTHVMEVYKVLFNMGIRCPNMLAAAILHDIIEDTEYDYDDIAKEFNMEVAEYVLECSRLVGDGKETLQVKHDFLQTFFTKSLGSVLIKIADRYVNTMDYYRDGREIYAAWYALQAYPIYARYFDAINKGTFHIKNPSEYVGPLVRLIKHHYGHYVSTPKNGLNPDPAYTEILLKKPDENEILEKPAVLFLD